MSDIKEIIFEDINDDYGYGKYGEFEVIINKRTGYINATKLCKDGGKELFSWVRTNVSNKLVDFISESLHICRDRLLINPKNLPNHLKGTYVHPDLIPHIASWVSPEFAHKVSKIVNEHIIKQYRNELRKKDDKIDNLEKIIREMREENRQALREIKEDNKQTHNKLDVANENLNVVTEKLDVANENLNVVTEKLDVANENIVTTIEILDNVAQQRVPFERIQPPEEPQIIIFYTDQKEEKPYKICRGQKRRINGIIRSVKEEFPNAREVVRMKRQPNPVESWNACKRELTRNMEWEGSKFSLVDITEEEFLERINEIVEDVKREPVREIKEQIIYEEIKEEIPNQVERRRELLNLKLDSLRALCKEKGIKGYSKLRKDQVVDLIIDNE